MPTNVVDLIEEPEEPGGPDSPDTDGDGLTDDEEATLGTNPEFPDTDGDGANDGDEVAAGSNPMDGTSTPGNIVDTDEDGLRDDQEAVIGTDPNNADTDGDGFEDKEEVDAGTDPLDLNDFPVQPPNEIYSLGDDTGPVRVKNGLEPFLKATYGLVWESGDKLVKEFPVTIHNDHKLEDNETVLLKLEEPFRIRRWAMTTNAFDELVLDLASNQPGEVDPYWVQNFPDRRRWWRRRW